MFQIPTSVTSNSPEQTFAIGKIFGETVIAELENSVVISLEGTERAGKSNFNYGFASAFVPDVYYHQFKKSFFDASTSSGRYLACYDAFSNRPCVRAIFERHTTPILSVEHIYPPFLMRLFSGKTFPTRKYPPDFHVKFDVVESWNLLYPFRDTQKRIIEIKAKDRKKHSDRLGAFAERVKMQLS